MRKKNGTRGVYALWNASLLALVIFLAAMLYVIETEMSGASPHLSLAPTAATPANRLADLDKF